VKALLKYAGLIILAAGWIVGTATWLLKLGWRVDALEARVTTLEATTKGLYDDNLLRKGASEVWKARGTYGPQPKTNDH
jgi:hypothetical protein